MPWNFNTFLQKMQMKNKTIDQKIFRSSKRNKKDNDSHLFLTPRK